MPLDTREKGRRAEDIACSYLKQNGYDIIDRNHHGWRGEVDIVAKKDGVFAFVEVKSGRTFKGTSLISKINKKKMERIIMATRHWLAVNNIIEHPMRWDVIAISKGQVEHIISAFTMDNIEPPHFY